MRFSKKLFLAIRSFTSRRLKVLAYHGVTSSAASFYNVSTGQFREQMSVLKERNYRVLPLREAVERLYSNRLDKKSIVLTFDDAHESIIDNAVPCLLELGFPASVFVPTSRLGPSDASWGKDKKNNTLDWDQLASLPNSGIDIHSHSVSHVDLTALDSRQLEYELRHSLETLRGRFGDGDYYLAYPFGRKNQNVVSMARTVRYKGAFGFGSVLSNWRQTDPYRLKREAVLATTTIGQFRRKIDASYDLIRCLRVHPALELKRLIERLAAKSGGE